MLYSPNKRESSILMEKDNTGIVRDHENSTFLRGEYDQPVYNDYEYLDMQY